MKIPHLHPSLLLVSATTVLFSTVARAEDNVVPIKFSDPTKPGTVKVLLARGDLRVRGEDTAEVTVTSEAKPVTKAPRKDGLRVLTSSTSFALSEKDNVVTLDALSEGWAGPGANFRLTVPRATSIIVANSFGGDITCNGISGDVEIKSMNGEVTLTDLAGGALVDTMNGQIHANIQALHDGKPLSFTSMNGEVVLRVPAEAKANVRLRTQNGAILTDFDDKALVTKTEAVARTPRTARPRSSGSSSRDDIHAAVREAVQAGVEAASEVAAAAREVAQAAREAAAEARAEGGSPVPPIPPMPPLPPMTGGRLVYGTLNGGGPEINVTTMNGDVTLRHSEAKK